MRTASLFVSALAVASSVLGVRTDGQVGKKRVPGAYIFELDETQDASDFYATVSVEGETRLNLDYQLFKGISVQLHDIDNAEDRAIEIASAPAVKRYWPVELYSIPKPNIEWIGSEGMAQQQQHTGLRRRQNETGDTYSTHVMTQVDKLRAEGITGKGVKVAVIDTGIDYNHPALGGCFGEGCLVAFGTDLVGDDYDGYNIPVPDEDPMDCYGHGTHVAGIVAAQENEFGFTGAAPDVTLGAYKVFGCEGEAGNDVLIASYNQAYEDGADVITASIGGPSGWTEDPWAVAVSRIVDAGVPCPVSAGNDGAAGLFYASTAANGKGVTAIASNDNTQSPTFQYLSSYSIDGSGTEEFGYTPAEPAAWDNVSLPLWAPEYDTTIPDGGCAPYPDDTPDLADYIVLVRRGTCTFVEKAQNAADKGARYFIVYNNQPSGAGSFDVSTVPGILAAAMVTADVGVAWIEALEAGSEVILEMTGPENAEISVTFPENTVTGGALSTYTSWGPTWGVDVKPQISSPGGQILSTYPLALGEYAVLSGTSMACPLVAGVIALIGEVRGTFDPTEIENVLSAYANPQLFNDGTGFSDFLAPVPQQGGGLIQAYDAAYATTLLSPSSLSFNDTANFAESLNFTLSNTGTEEVSYDLSHVGTVSMYTLDAGSIYPAAFPNEAVDVAATLALSDAKVSVPAGGSVTVEVVATPPEGLDAERLSVWSGYVAINGSDGTSLSLPYQGVSGSLYEHTVLAQEDAWISRSTTQPIIPIPENVTMILPAPGSEPGNGTVTPLIMQYLALGSAQVNAEVYALTEGSSELVGQPFGYPLLYQPRGETGYEWLGDLNSGEYVPAGRYQIVVRALRITGDSANEADWDVVETTPFAITYQE